MPWEIKFENQVEKALLRNAMAEYLPEKILTRKKSPYPKTQNPEYERAVRDALQERLQKKNTPLSSMLNKKKFEELLGDLLVKPQGKPTLVPLSDKRPVWNTAQVDFKE